jgi:isoleucyl-tRNA synthetase
MHWRDIRNQLRQVFADHYPSKEEQRIAALPMVLNRGWGREDVGTDADWGVVGGWEEGGGKARGEGKDGEEREQEKMGAAELYGFPGLVFEVLKNGAVSCLMVY